MSASQPRQRKGTPLAKRFTCSLIDLQQLGVVEQSLKIGPCEAFGAISYGIQILVWVRKLQVAAQGRQDLQTF